MSTETYDQWIHKLTKNFAAPLQLTEWNKATTELYQKIAQQNLELLEENFERTSDQLKRLAHIKKPDDLIHFQKECLNEDMAAAIEYMQKLIRSSVNNIDEFSKLCGSAIKETTHTERSGK